MAEGIYSMGLKAAGMKPWDSWQQEWILLDKRQQE
jgi:hypothetical protein